MPITRAQLERQLGRLVADFPGELHALRRRAFWKAAQRFTPVLAVDRDGGRLFVSTADLVLGRRLFCYPDARETDIVYAFQALRSIPGVADRLNGCRAIEIGANIGSHTVEMLRDYGVGSVTAIEPDSDNAALPLQNGLV